MLREVASDEPAAMENGASDPDTGQQTSCCYTNPLTRWLPNCLNNGLRPKAHKSEPPPNIVQEVEVSVFHIKMRE